MAENTFARDADYYLELQTQTGWGRTLYGFAAWCAPQPHWRTLDVGCGPGLLPAIFARFDCGAFGVDVDAHMFRPAPLHPWVSVADISHLPFKRRSFDLITASNLVFLLPEPATALRRLVPFLKVGGKLAMLNPSEFLDEPAAIRFSDENGLKGVARQTLLNWAGRAVRYNHWTEDETHALYRDAGMRCMGTALKVGPGFGRFSWGLEESAG